MAFITPQQPISGGLLPTTRGTGGNVPGGLFGELLVTEALPQYHALVKSGVVFSLAVLGASPTAFTGGAAGTPLLGLYNPAGSGKDLVLLEVRLGVRTTGTAAGTVDFNYFTANNSTATVTGTQTLAKNLYTQATSGSVAWGMTNVANTGAVASTIVAPAFSLGNVTTTAALNFGILRDELKGEIVVSPGNYLALGASASLTAASIDASFIWAEVTT